MIGVDKKVFGRLGRGEECFLYTLCAGDFSAQVCDFGAALVSLVLPGKEGPRDIVLGYADPRSYETDKSYMGVVVGRCANRVAGARFRLDGREFRLSANEGVNHLHGGVRGFGKALWTARGYEEGGAAFVRLSRSSPDGEEGYPGTVLTDIVYKLEATGRLCVFFSARTDAPTPVNLTSHSYFNLAGAGSILDHELRILASAYIPVDDKLIPLPGSPRPIRGGALDFRSAKKIGRDIAELGGAYDHCFVLDESLVPLMDGVHRDSAAPLRPCAELRHADSGIGLRMSASMPGLQFYSGNFLSGKIGKEGRAYDKHAGLCLEAQFFPDSPNRPDFPSVILRPGESWNHAICYDFDLEP